MSSHSKDPRTQQIASLANDICRAAAEIVDVAKGDQALSEAAGMAAMALHSGRQIAGAVAPHEFATPSRVSYLHRLNIDTMDREFAVIGDELCGKWTHTNVAAHATEFTSLRKAAAVAGMLKQNSVAEPYLVEIRNGLFPVDGYICARTRPCSDETEYMAAWAGHRHDKITSPLNDVPPTTEHRSGAVVFLSRDAAEERAAAMPSSGWIAAALDPEGRPYWFVGDENTAQYVGNGRDGATTNPKHARRFSSLQDAHRFVERMDNDEQWLATSLIL